MAEQAQLTDELAAAESLLISGEDELALELLSRLAEDVEEYVDRNCVATDEVQWFSFPTIFERLAYRRVEGDPRELHDFGEPLDRLYSDLALAHVRLGDYEAATNALKQACRWNPMGCAYRLDLADLFLTAGDLNEYLALSYSVFERASDVRHLSRAFLNFARHFQQTGRDEQAAAALRCARRLGARDDALAAALDQAAGTASDPDSIADERASELLAAEGLPDAANAEVAVCLLMCASDAARAGDKAQATSWMVQARDLVGAPAAAALLELINESESDGEGEA